MSDHPVYRPYAEAPAHASFLPLQAGEGWAGARSRRFEIVSRGDFVTGILHQPEAEVEKLLPLVIAVHDVAESGRSESVCQAAAWLSRGLAVATLDLPLHGTRSSPKLSERLTFGLRRLESGEDLDPESGALVEEFLRQATSDLVRTAEALAAEPDIDADRVGVLGFGTGAALAAHSFAHAPGMRAAMLVVLPTFATRSDLDPAAAIDSFGKRPHRVLKRVSASDAIEQLEEFLLESGLI